jgi:hypothetical protein
MSAVDFTTTFHEFSRPLTLVSPDGLTTSAINAVLRPLRPDELVGAAEQMSFSFIAKYVDLVSAGFEPLRKNSRIVDGDRSYTVAEQSRTNYAGTGAALVKVLVRG